MTGIILAAGKSQRMKSDLPKVLLPLAGKPLLFYVLKVAQESGLARIIIVVGRSHNQVKKALAGAKVEFVLQKKLLGTADAVKTCANLLTDNEEIVVFCGDTPLLTAKTIKKLIAVHQQAKADATVLTAILENPSGYGRIIRDAQSQVTAIVEERDASDKIKKIKEINSGVFVFRWQSLRPILNELKPSPITNEYYLTDAIVALKASGAKVVAYCTPDSSEILGVNTKEEFEQVARILAKSDEAA
jgi:bifunctional UDP-N-acetylglucosamine pyrophosphorylase/glucosamine-1-phosphate N-acetyltransferase|uniref:UDP-N-acetylglucosamine diphosphorylase n=1 Tax=candidate division WOR-3 bacterium TaxID=2052148 RepID=A0A7C6E9U0_UNCW3